ncbi:MAG: hypothetical protein GX207_04755 [Peptococcaceae bacterium]|nr:hypothetical protein [Peptococcaceae bacterium]
MNSGLTDYSQAQIKYIIWTQEESELASIEKIIQQTNLTWKKSILRNYFQNRAYEYIAQITISKNEEAEILNTYLSLNRKMKKFKAKVYMEEIIPANIDVNDFLLKNNVVNLERIKISNMTSVTGFAEGLGQGIILNGRVVNLQIVTGTKNLRPGKTILAFPALY